jgi:hypothetical protein
MLAKRQPGLGYLDPLTPLRGRRIVSKILVYDARAICRQVDERGALPGWCVVCSFVTGTYMDEDGGDC